MNFRKNPARFEVKTGQLFHPAVASDRWTPIADQTSGIVDVCLAITVGVFGLAIALMTLDRGIWLDEFFTIAATSNKSPSQFFHFMIARDVHPFLHYAFVYLLQAAGQTSVAVLRSINLLGIVIVIGAIVWGYRQEFLKLPQALLIWVLFVSGPYFLDYFGELRSYLLLHATSIGISIVWYALMRRIETDRELSVRMIFIWTACLLFYTNLHYFATLFGGALTAALLVSLALRRLWWQAVIVACSSLAAAAPALTTCVLQIASTSKINLTTWISTSTTDSIKIIARTAQSAAAWNLAAIASALVTCLYLLEDQRKWKEYRIAIILLSIVALFFAALVGVNFFKSIVVDRYLIACAGAITVSIAILAASQGSPKWLPAAAGVIAILMQANSFRLNFRVDQHGWLPSARAVAQQTMQCPGTKVFVYPVYDLSSVGYGYYANKFNFSYEVLRHGDTVAASGPCPSVVWVEHLLFNTGVDAAPEQIFDKLQIRSTGAVEVDRYGWGALIIVRNGSALTYN